MSSIFRLGVTIHFEKHRGAVSRRRSEEAHPDVLFKQMQASLDILGVLSPSGPCGILAYSWYARTMI